MAKSIFCSIYSLDNKKRCQEWFIKEFRRRLGPYEKRKQLRIESDWQSINPTDKFFIDRCQDSEYTMFLYDGSEKKDSHSRLFEHYQSKAIALHGEGKTLFVPIGLGRVTDADINELGLSHYKPIRFETDSDNESAWTRLLEDIFPDEVHPQMNAYSPEYPHLPPRREESSEDQLMQKVLRCSWKKLKDSLDLKTCSILDHLLQDEIISLDFNESLNSKPLRRDQTEALLNLLSRRPAEHIKRFFNFLKPDYRFLYDFVVKEIQLARASAAKRPVSATSPKSSSSWFSGATMSLETEDPSVRFPIPSTESDETLLKTDEIPFVTQQLGQVSLGGDNAEFFQSRHETVMMQQPNFSLTEDGADGSDAAMTSVALSENSDPQQNMSNVSDEPTLHLQSPLISYRGTTERSTFDIKVRRGNVLKELMAIFHTETLENILRAKVEAEFTGEAIGSGVLLDILSAFWDEFFQQYSEGEDEKVPFVHNDLIREKLKCAGCILRFGFEYQPENEPLRFFPHQLCLASIIDVIHPHSISKHIPEMEVIWSASLYAYVGAIYGAKIKAIYEDPDSASDDQWDDINEMLDDLFQKKYVVNAGNIKERIAHLADVHLLQKPQTSLKYMELEDWKNLYPEEFGDIDKIVKLSKQFHPTSDDVLKALIEKETSKDIEAEALKNLRRFIRGLNEMDLRKFLRFVTGSALKPKEILVEFSKDKHRPINARTCSSLLYIPLELKFNEFKKRFSHIISSEMHQDMTTVLTGKH